jgi:carbohydrate-selective porin OprB
MHTLTDTEQKPLRTGFGPTTTASEAAAGVNLQGKTAVVTGGSSGIGAETVGLNYGCTVRPGLLVQPSLQYIVNPGRDRAVPNALAIGVNVVFNC